MSLYLVSDSFTDDFLDTVTLEEIEDPEVLFVAGDIPDDVVLSDEEANAIFANSKQVREDIKKRKLSRGYVEGKSVGKGKKPYSGMAGPRKWTKTQLMQRTKCARCGQTGHWARDCKKPPDEHGKRRLDSSGKPFFNSFITQAIEQPEQNEVIVTDSFIMMIHSYDEEPVEEQEPASLVADEASHTHDDTTTIGDTELPPPVLAQTWTVPKLPVRQLPLHPPSLSIYQLLRF